MSLFKAHIKIVMPIFFGLLENLNHNYHLIFVHHYDK
jgi:hypothetical protein